MRQMSDTHAITNNLELTGDPSEPLWKSKLAKIIRYVKKKL